jgi:putative transcriptional regulator
MIRFRIRELMAEMAFQENRRISLEEISQKTGVNRTTLSKMINIRGYNTTVENLDRLCEFFGCPLSGLAEYVYVAPKSINDDDTEAGG